MKTRYLFIFIVLAAAGFLGVKSFTNAATPADIQYPVKELGNCKSDADCKAYCDKPENTGACLAFAQKNGLMSEEEINIAKKFLKAAEKGPGGCNSKESCDEYCNDMSHIDECVAFAEKNNLLSPQELEETKKVQAAIKRGVKPPSCGNKKSCDAYCEESDHMEECITFGVESGFIQGAELEEAQKMLQAIKRGVKPPPCKGKDACDEYCSNPDNMEICMNFALEAGMMSTEEAANSQKMLQALKKGIKPPPCKGQKECDAFCSSKEHMEECINFSVAAGMMSEEEAQMARKTGGKGPGGCMGGEECDAFCNNPDNQEACFNFGRDNGLISPEQLKQMEEGKQQFKQGLEKAPAEVLDCIQSVVGSDMLLKMKSGTFLPPKEMGDKTQGCFQKMGAPEPGEPGEGGMMGPAGQPGPGGCKTPEECKTYCDGHQEECQKFQPGPGEENPGGQMMPPQAGPGGCKTPEECQSYCTNNPNECKEFEQGQSQMQPGQPCEGENCKQVQQMQPGQIQPGQPCQGENCQQVQQGQQPSMQPCEGPNCSQVQQMQPGGQQPLEGGQQYAPGTGPNNVQGQTPPAGQMPSSDPGGGGSMAPGDQVPLIQPTEQQPGPSEPPPPPQEQTAPQTPPSEPTTFLINPDSLVASTARSFFNFLLGGF